MAIQQSLGDDFYAIYDGKRFILRNLGQNFDFDITTRAMLELFSFVRELMENEGKVIPKELNEMADVLFEGKFYRARLIRPLTIDEVYQQVAKS